MLRHAKAKVPSRAVLLTVGIVVTSTSVLAVPIGAAYGENTFTPGDLLVSTGVDDEPPHHLGYDSAAPELRWHHLHGGDVRTANAGGPYPQVFNNDAIDGSFGVTEPIVSTRTPPRSGQ